MHAGSHEVPTVQLEYLIAVQDFTGDVNGPVLWNLNLLDAQGKAISESYGNRLWLQNSFDPGSTAMGHGCSLNAWSVAAP